MYRILIVDDEVLIRKRIRFGFEWEELGFEVAGEADNGQSALDLMEKEAFDLAVVDIAMPGMNGIELVQTIRARNLPIEIIFLTGHSEFEYARIALKERVYAYVLKPINEEEFIKTLQELNQQKAAQHEKEREFTELREKKQTAEAILDNQKVLEMLYSSPVNQKSFGVEAFENKNWYLILIRLKEAYNSFEEYQEIRNQLMELPAIQECGAVYFDIQEGDFFLFLTEKEDRVHDWEKGLHTFQQQISDKMNQRIRIGVSKKFSKSSHLHEAYLQVVRSVRNCLVFENQLNTFSEIEKLKGKKYILPIDYIQNLKLAVETENNELSKETFHCIFSEMKEAGIEYREALRIGEQLISILSEITAKMQMDITGVMGDYHTVWAAYEYMESYAEVSAWFQEISEKIIKSFGENKKKGLKNEIVIQAKKYIKEHYMEPELTVRELADQLFVTDTYLSASFKKSMGMSLTQYITQYRLEKARELLSSGNQDVNKAAVLVGYNDEYYFSRCFKKYFSISPFQVKKQHAE